MKTMKTTKTRKNSFVFQDVTFINNVAFVQKINFRHYKNNLVSGLEVISEWLYYIPADKYHEWEDWIGSEEWELGEVPDYATSVEGETYVVDIVKVQ